MAKPRIEEQQPFLFGVLTYCKDNNLDAQQARAVCIKTAQVVPELRDELELGIEKLGEDMPWWQYPMTAIGNTFGGLYGAAKGTVGGLATGASYIPRAVTAAGEQLGVPGAETANKVMRGVNESLLDSTGAAFRDVGHAIPGKGYWDASPSAKLYDKRLRESEFQRGGRGLIRGGGASDFIGELALPFTGPGKVIQGAGKLIGATKYLPQLVRASRAGKVTAPIARQLARMFPQGSKWGDRGRGLANYVSGSRIPTGTRGVSDMMGKATPAASLLNSPVNASTLRAAAPRALGLGALVAPSADKHLTGGRIANKLLGGVLDRSGTFVENYPLESFDVNDPAQVKALQEAYAREQGALEHERVYDTIGQGEFSASMQQMRQHYESLTQGRSALDPRIRPTTDQMLQRSLEPSRVDAAKKRDVHLQEMVERQNQMAGGDPRVEAILDGWGRAFVPGVTLDDAQFKAIDPKQWADVERFTPEMETIILGMDPDDPAKESAVRQVLRNRALMMAKQRGVNPKELVEDIQKRMDSIKANGISTSEVMELMRANKDAAKAAEAPPSAADGAADAPSAAQWSVPPKPRPSGDGDFPGDEFGASRLFGLTGEELNQRLDANGDGELTSDELPGGKSTVVGLPGKGRGLVIEEGVGKDGKPWQLIQQVHIPDPAVGGQPTLGVQWVGYWNDDGSRGFVLTDEPPGGSERVTGGGGPRGGPLTDPAAPAPVDGDDWRQGGGGGMPDVDPAEAPSGVDPVTGDPLGTGPDWRQGGGGGMPDVDPAEAPSGVDPVTGDPIIPGDAGGLSDPTSGRGPTVDEAVEKVKGWYEGLDSTSQTLLWIGVPLAIAGIAVSLMSEDSGGIGILMTILGIAIGGLGAFGGGKWLEKLFGGGGGTEDGSGGTRGSPHIGGMQDLGLVQPFPSSPPGPWDSAPPPPGATAAGPSAGPAASPAATDSSDPFPGDTDGDGQISPQESVAAESNPAVLSQMINHPNASAVMLQQYQSDPKFKGKIDDIRGSKLSELTVIAVIKARMKLTSDQDAKMMYDLAKGLAV